MPGFNPWEQYNTGLANLGQTINQMGQRDMQRENMTRQNSLADLQLQQGNRELQHGQAADAALIQATGAPNLSGAMAAQAKQAQAGIAQKQQAEKQKMALDTFKSVSEAVKSGTITPEAAGDFYHNSLKMNGVDLDGAGVKMTFKADGGYFSGPVAPDTLFMVNGQPMPFGSKGTIKGARVAGISPEGKPIYEQMKDSEFKSVPVGKIIDKTVPLGNKVFVQYTDGTSEYMPVAASPNTIVKIENGNNRGRGGNGKGAMPATALKMQQEAVDAIGTASSIKADLGAVLNQIDSGKLDLGLISNTTGKLLNLAGMSTESSRNLNTFKATLEKLRNDSLRLNKGVQTDGDAVRAWKELMDNINDKDVVKQRLAEIQQINERGAVLQEANVENIRNNYGLEPLDTSVQKNVRPAIGGGKRTAQPPQGKGIKTKSDPLGIL